MFFSSSQIWAHVLNDFNELIIYSFIAMFCPFETYFQQEKQILIIMKFILNILEDVRMEICLVNIKLEWVLRLTGRNRKFLKCFDVIYYVWLVDLIWN